MHIKGGEKYAAAITHSANLAKNRSIRSRRPVVSKQRLHVAAASKANVLHSSRQALQQYWAIPPQIHGSTSSAPASPRWKQIRAWGWHVDLANRGLEHTVFADLKKFYERKHPNYRYNWITLPDRPIRLKDACELFVRDLCRRKFHLRALQEARTRMKYSSASRLKVLQFLSSMHETQLAAFDSTLPFLALIGSSEFIRFLLQGAVGQHPQLQRLRPVLTDFAILNMTLRSLINQLLQLRRSNYPREWDNRIKEHLRSYARTKTSERDSMTSILTGIKRARAAVKENTGGKFEHGSAEYTFLLEKKLRLMFDLERTRKAHKLLLDQPRLWPAYSISRGFRRLFLLTMAPMKELGALLETRRENFASQPHSRSITDLRSLEASIGITALEISDLQWELYQLSLFKVMYCHPATLTSRECIRNSQQLVHRYETRERLALSQQLRIVSRVRRWHERMTPKVTTQLQPAPLRQTNSPYGPLKVFLWTPDPK